MNDPTPTHSSAFWLAVLVGASGLAALSWETLWQHHAALALGVSAEGTAITLATTMAGMSLGAYSMGALLRRRTPRSPLRWYGVIELVIGIYGLLLPAAFDAIKTLDAWIYGAHPSGAGPVHIVSIACALGIPTLGMGATFPLFGLLARAYGTSLSLLYGLNTIGAALGTLLVALLGVPALGIIGVGRAVALVNLCVFGFTRVYSATPPSPQAVRSFATPLAPLEPRSSHGIVYVSAAVFATGFATFALEVAWFRSLRAAFRSTTDAFAVMLASVLIALGVAAHLARVLRQRGSSPALLLALGGIFTIAATPIIERFDTINYFGVSFVLLVWLAMSLLTLGPAVLCLGTVLPYFLDEGRDPRVWSRLYVLNTFGCVIGALVAAWLLLPAFGFARTAWGIGMLLAAAGMAGLTPRLRGGVAVATGGALLLAAAFTTGIGSVRTQGQLAPMSYELLAFDEGPDATVTAIEYQDKSRALVIDGFQAASEMFLNHYMAWMGHLPMMLSERTDRALVICFGTGQTANAVRREGAGRLDIVDLNRAVFAMAGYFPSNEEVLKDPAVHSVVMDGRAYLRRTDAKYDVITLEPMPPNFAGVNALYSREFYEDARTRLNDGGVIAQWVPFHLITPVTSASIARTFVEVFPGAVLWLDPVTPTGILLGRKGGGAISAGGWPGFSRRGVVRDLSPVAVAAGVLLSADALAAYASAGRTVTDDNQFLSYGREAMGLWRYGYNLLKPNMEILSKLTGRALPTER